MHEFFSRTWARILFLIILGLQCHLLFSQNIQNEVVATTGDTYIVDDHEFSWTLGECFIETFQTDQFLISEGFHQPTFIFFTINELKKPGFEVIVFPNPSNRYVRIQLKEYERKDKFWLTLYNCNGKCLLDQAFVPEQKNIIDLGRISEGILVLSLIRLKDGSKQSFRVIKTD